MTELYDNIPAEIKEYNQWVCWRYETKDGSKEKTKVPYNPAKGTRASTTNSDCWVSYAFAEKAAKMNLGYSGIGFVLTENDPFAFIDLDDSGYSTEILERHKYIYRMFDSYSEVTPSNKGLHIIVKGKVPSGRKREKIEVYSSHRYMTMTGNAYNSVPIRDRQDMLQNLWEELGPFADATADHVGAPDIYDDNAVLEMAAMANNGEKFLHLWNGYWKQLGYFSQSEADFALIDIIAFYTQNYEQIKRLFRHSPAGQRKKAQRDDYLMRMILRSMDTNLTIDFSPLITTQTGQYAGDSAINIVDSLKKETQLQPDEEQTDHKDRYLQHLKPVWEPQAVFNPPGLVGDLTAYFMKATPRPVNDILLIGALGFVSGVSGRAFNVSGTGLNHYYVLLADSGVGKEGIDAGISKIMETVSKSVPAVYDFWGPGRFASGQAMSKALNTQPVFFSIFSEFSELVPQIASNKSTPHMRELKRVMLDLYNKSGKTDTYREAAYADKDKNSLSVRSPAMTVICASTPDRLYDALSDELIQDGFLPRFSVFHSRVLRPRFNKDHEKALMSKTLENNLINFVSHALELQQKNETVDVGYADEEVVDYLDKLNYICDDIINTTTDQNIRTLWSRVHLQVLKISSALAVGINPYDPKIDLICTKWATNFVVTCCMNMVKQVESERLGCNTSQTRQLNKIQQVIGSYFLESFSKTKNHYDYRFRNARIIPYRYIFDSVKRSRDFKKDTRGVSQAIQIIMSILIDSGDISEVPHHIMQKEFGKRQRAYYVMREDCFTPFADIKK